MGSSKRREKSGKCCHPPNSELKIGFLLMVLMVFRLRVWVKRKRCWVRVRRMNRREIEMERT